MDVVVPASNEAAVLPACLAALLRQEGVSDLRIVVVANGCTDDTAEQARSFIAVAAARGHELRVLDLPVAGKAAALNAASSHLRGGSSTFLDADIVLGPGALQALVDRLESLDTPALAAPARSTFRPHDRVIAQYHTVREALPSMRSGVIGGGCYAVNQAGRARWGRFPDLRGDDMYVRSRFPLHEQHVLAHVYFLSQLTDDRREMVRLASRWHRGNREVHGAQVSWTSRALRHVRDVHAVRRHWRALPAFLAVSLLARTTRGAGRWPRALSVRRQASTPRPSALVSPRVHVVIVTYASEQLIETCLDALSRQNADLSVTVVDNASPDATCVVVGRRAGIRLIRNRVNVGFAEAVNQAAEGVAADYLLLLNPDVQLAEGALEHLLTLSLLLPAGGLYGGRAQDTHGRLDMSSALAAPSVRQAIAFGTGLTATGRMRLDPDSLGGWRRDDCRSVPVLTGAVLLVTADLWRRLDGFDTRYVMYGEDVDLCLRARRLGARPAFTHHCRYVHVHGASSTQSTRLQLTLRGKVTLFEQHLTPLRSRLAHWLLFGGVGLRAAGGPLSSRGEIWRKAWLARSQWRSGWPALDRAEAPGSAPRVPSLD
jgi:N-acetylglucosaminyl-diphospho-decaprenol L-rhamnosyltransferase